MPNLTNKRPFAITCKGSECEVLLYDVIDQYNGVGAKQFRDELKAAGKVSTIHLRINSQGGNVFDGLAIYNTLRQHPARVVVHVDGMALSMASVVAMAGDEIEMADNAWMMIHNPMNVGMGDAEDLRAMAEQLDKLKASLVETYAARTKQPSEKVAQMMDAETWLSAQESVALGFADRRSESLAIAAQFDLSGYQNVPAAIAAALHQASGAAAGSHSTSEESMTQATTSAAAPAAATFAELEQGLVDADATFLCAQLKAQATLPQAQAAWMAEQKKRLAAAQQELADERKAQAAAKMAGVETLGAGTAQPGESAGSDAMAAFEAALAAKTAAKPGLSRAKAVSEVVRENPRLHEDYVAAYNAQHHTARGPASAVVTR